MGHLIAFPFVIDFVDFFCLVIKVQMTSNNIELIANMKHYAHKIINN